MSNYSEGVTRSNEATETANIYFGDILEMSALHDLDEMDAEWVEDLVYGFSGVNDLDNGFLIYLADKVLSKVNWEELAAHWAGVQNEWLAQQDAA